MSGHGSFVSYAQNGEDVLLWRALGHIKNGFYIDVGANDPVEHSVTKAFYDAGWNGINVEPLPVFHQDFLALRPRDINLAIAAGAEDGELTLYDVPAVRGWASPEASVAELHRSEGHEVAELTVPVRTLASICAEHVKGDIHFLKVDVEGFEGEVLRGMDFALWRPWVLVIEATLPNSRTTNHATWEHLVTSQRYRYAWFDGLNRYYVAEEHAELLAQLDIQPNVFDAFIPHHLDKAWQQIEALEEHADHAWARTAEMEQRARQADALERQCALLRQQLRDSEAHAEQAELQVQTLNAKLHETATWGQDLERRLLAMLNSRSWRITAPLRFVADRGPNGLVGFSRRKAKGAARRALRSVTQNETVRRTVLPVVMRSPRLQELVARVLAAAKQATSAGATHGPQVPPALRELPQSAREALEQLRRAYEPDKK